MSQMGFFRRGRPFRFHPNRSVLKPVHRSCVYTVLMCTVTCYRVYIKLRARALRGFAASRDWKKRAIKAIGQATMRRPKR